MRIFSSTNLENLVDYLSNEINQPKTSIFEKDLIIVQSKAMSKWLNIQLAEKNKISAQIEFPFLRSFIVDCIKRCGIRFDDKYWSREVLLWRIYSLLPQIENDVIHSYIYKPNDNEIDEIKLYQLSNQLSNVFDEYMLYRPDWLRLWESGSCASLNGMEEQEKWQMKVWNALVREDSKQSMSIDKSLNEFFETDSHLNFDSLNLPKKISVFGVTNMPPVFVMFFEKLSERFPEVEIDFHYLTPCSKYWAELKIDRSLFKRTSQDELMDLKVSYRSLNSYELLRSWGALGRDFLTTLLNYSEYNEIDLNDEKDLVTTTSLNKIQNEIYNLEDHRQGKKLENDKSIVINSCHSLLRELEVLKDYIYSLLDRSSDLKPVDVIVLCPNVKDYVPLIKTVFNHEDGVGKHHRINYSISDQSLSNSSLVVNLFYKLLNIHKSRLTSNDVIEILESPYVLKQFGLVHDDLDLVKGWLRSAEIRWGKDSDFKLNLIKDGPVNFEQNSWRFGLDRLLSGYAYDEETLFDDHLSMPVGSDGLVLGKFSSFLDKLFQLYDQLNIEHSVHDWSPLLKDIVNHFIADDYTISTERRLIHIAIAELSKHWRLSAQNGNLASPLVIDRLNSYLDAQSSSHGYMNGGVTFCSLLPMRSIPAKAICILGMNDGDFPRIDRRSGFDLMTKNWRQGDRSVNLDDRYLFLESFLSAKENFYVSYTGFDKKDNSEIPPSIVVSEFLEVLNSTIDNFSITKHRLNAYSHKYFEGTGLESYSLKNFKFAKAIDNQQKQDVDFCSKPLALPFERDGFLEIELKDLINFYKNPSKHFIQTHLNTRVQSLQEDQLLEDENFDAPKGLDGYKLSEELYENILNKMVRKYGKKWNDLPQDTKALKSELSEELFLIYKAKGILPFGEEGRKTFRVFFHEMFEFYLSNLKRENNEDEESITIHQEMLLGDKKVLLKGTIPRVFSKAYLPLSFSKLLLQKKIKADKLFAVIIPYFALLNHSTGSGDINELVISFKDTTKKLTLLDSTKGAHHLEALVGFYLKGSQQPFPFFPKAFNKFFPLMKGKEPEQEMRNGLLEARKSWIEGNKDSGILPDHEDESHRLCFGEDFPGENKRYESEYLSILEVLTEMFQQFKWEDV